jgi:flagellar biosynthesis protein FliQ
MTPDQISSIIHQCMIVTIVTSLPPVILGLIVGLFIAVFQAVTQVQEQTLTFVPKMVIVMLAFAIMYPWIMQSFVELALSLWTAVPQYSQ